MGRGEGGSRDDYAGKMAGMGGAEEEEVRAGGWMYTG